MKELSFGNELRIYGVYKFKQYPDWNVLVTGSGLDCHKKEYMEGLAFSLDGKFETGVSLSLPLWGEEIGYIYIPNVTYSLELKFNNHK